MTDRQILEEMFRKRGIEFSVPETPEGPLLLGFIVEAGYCGFYSSFRFDEDGMLLAVEAYE